MSRDTDFYTIRDNRPVYLTGLVAKVLDRPMSKTRRGLTIGGCGMDMIASCVMDVSAILAKRSDWAPLMEIARRGAPYLLRHEQL
jgi:hypothetical protein